MGLPRVCAVLAISLWLAACSSPTSPTPTKANISVSILPSPITAMACGPPLCPVPGEHSASLNITIRETAGVGGNVNSITITAMVGNAPIGVPISLDPTTITQAAGTNHMSARGSLVVPDTFYTVALPLVVNVSVTFVDDNGHQIVTTAQVNAQ